MNIKRRTKFILKNVFQDDNLDNKSFTFYFFNVLEEVVEWEMTLVTG